MQATTALTDWLLGRWRIERRLQDHKHQQTGHFQGEAVFSPVGDEVFYDEAGHLQLGAFDGEAKRRYIYCPQGGWQAEVLFADRRYFCSIDLSDGQCQVAHPCAQDTYYGTFTRVSADELHIDWRVTGPTKQFAIANRLYRQR